MSSVLDQTADPTRQEFAKFARLYDLPDYVKNANRDILERDDEIASTAFADVRNRQFRCDTKAAAWVSYMYFMEKRSQMHPKIAEWVEQRLDAFANHWGIAGDVEQLREKHAELNTENLSDDDYMIVWASDGRKDRHYTLRNPGEVKVAAEWFANHRDHFTYYDRKTMATKLLEKAAQFGVMFGDDLDEMLERQSGRGTYIPKEAADFIRNRILAAPAKTPPEFKERLTKLADQVQVNGHLASDPQSVAQLCNTIDVFDRLTKLAGHYTDILPRPEDVLCKGLYKTARAAVDEAVQLTTGTVYNRNDFSNMKLSQIRDVFGDDIADACCTGLGVDAEKAAEVFATLPRNDANILDRVLSDVGVHPMAKAATAVNRPQHQLLKQLAEIDQFAAT